MSARRISAGNHTGFPLTAARFEHSSADSEKICTTTDFSESINSSFAAHESVLQAFGQCMELWMNRLGSILENIIYGIL